MKSSTYKALKTDENGYVQYNENDIATWQILYSRQAPLALKHACRPYIEGFERLAICESAPAQIPDIDKTLKAQTGWTLEPVPALINFNRFFGLLANNKFPAATFMRRPEEIDYLEEPDLFHEVVGHCPMLTNEQFAKFSQWIGKIGVDGTPKQQKTLARLYWFTVEFGLIREDDQLKIFGGGILSSPLEILHSLDATVVEHRKFNLRQILRTEYKINEPQPIYYVLDNFEQLLSLKDVDIYSELDAAIHDVEFNTV